MTEPKFTTGPWNTATVISQGKIYAAVIDEHRERLCTMPDYGAAAQANAVLMSYAPQMYAELEEAACLLRAAAMFIENHYGDCPIVAWMQHEADNIDGLLAKARGERQ